MDTREMLGRINCFYNTDFKDGIAELIIYDNRRYILRAQKELDGQIIAFHKMRCSILAEMTEEETKYGLRVHFDKL